MSLVSVGVPTYNRPEGLRRVLDCVLGQTYKNLEVVISDNCSENPEVAKVAKSYCEADSRVRYTRQPSNVGPFANFACLLKEASGKYFMWAADDDIFHPFYIERIVQKFSELPESSVVAVNMEAQYFDDHGRYDNNEMFGFFPEGEPFYDFVERDAFDRVSHMIEHNYGNLVYSIYDLAVLKSMNIAFTENEVPFLLRMAEKGHFIVIPEVGFLKCTRLYTYLQARWEKEGGVLPVPVSPSCAAYHERALKDILHAISQLPFGEGIKSILAEKASSAIWGHYNQMLMGYKAV